MNIDGWKDLRPFDRWVYSNIPTVFGNEMSYYEKLCKVVQLLNDTMNDVNILHDEFVALNGLYEQLKLYVDNYFNNLDVQAEINNKLDDMVNSGELERVFGSYLNSWVNVMLYGMDNTGIAPCDSIMSTIISTANGRTIYFPSGTYIFNGSINFPDKCNIVMDGNAELKLMGTQDYFITIRKGSSRSDYAFSTIQGGIINANRNANTAIAFNKCKGLLCNCHIKNFNMYGIKTSTENNPDGNMRYENIIIENDKNITETETTGTIGIYDNGFDTKAFAVEIINAQTAIKTISGEFINVHAWIRSKNLIQNSVFAVIDGLYIMFNGCTIDTYRYGFQITQSNYGAIINSLIAIINSGVYDSEMQTIYPPYLIHNPNNLATLFRISQLKMTPSIQLNDSNLTYNNFFSDCIYSNGNQLSIGNEPRVVSVNLNSNVTGEVNRIIVWSRNLEILKINVTYPQTNNAIQICPVAPGTWNGKKVVVFVTTTTGIVTVFTTVTGAISIPAVQNAIGAYALAIEKIQ